MSKAKATLIISDDCHRQCRECRNKIVNEKAINLTAMYPLRFYDRISVHGGEPMNDPKRTLKILEVLRKINEKAQIYLYTAKYSVEMIALMEFLSGITYFIPASAAIADIVGFNKFQVLATRHPELSFRLHIHPNVTQRIPVRPLTWERIISQEITSMNKPEAGETVYRLTII